MEYMKNHDAIESLSFLTDMYILKKQLLRAAELFKDIVYVTNLSHRNS